MDPDPAALLTRIRIQLIYFILITSEEFSEVEKDNKIAQIQKKTWSWSKFTSVAEPPLFRAAPAPDVRGPRAYSSSGQKKRFRLQAKKGGSRRARLLTSVADPDDF